MHSFFSLSSSISCQYLCLSCGHQPGMVLGYLRCNIRVFTRCLPPVMILPILSFLPLFCIDYGKMCEYFKRNRKGTHSTIHLEN